MEGIQEEQSDRQLSSQSPETGGKQKDACQDTSPVHEALAPLSPSSQHLHFVGGIVPLSKSAAESLA